MYIYIYICVYICKSIFIYKYINIGSPAPLRSLPCAKARQT